MQIVDNKIGFVSNMKKVVALWISPLYQLLLLKDFFIAEPNFWPVALELFGKS